MKKKLLAVAIAATLASPMALAQSNNRTVIVGGQFPHGGTQMYTVPPGSSVVIVPGGRTTGRPLHEDMVTRPPTLTGNEQMDETARAAYDARMRAREMADRHFKRQ